MKKNYQIIMEEILNNLDGKKRLLLHSCCGPCSSYVIKTLTPYFDITILYYNPNIEPYDEYLKRKEEEMRFIKEFPNVNRLDFLDCDYDNEKFKELAKGLENEREGGARCIKCYYERLKKTAMLAKESDFDYFCTTLTVSPYKNSAKINELGAKLEEKYEVKYLYSDFKKKNGYKESIKLSEEYKLYRQDYCGCLYSKEERKVVN